MTAYAALHAYIESCVKAWGGGDLSYDAHGIARRYATEVDDLLQVAYEAAWVNRENLEALLRAGNRGVVRKHLVRAMELWAAEERAQRVLPRWWITDVDLAKQIGWWTVGGKRASRLVWTRDILRDADLLCDDEELPAWVCPRCRECSCRTAAVAECAACDDCIHPSSLLAEILRDKGFTRAMLQVARGTYVGTEAGRKKAVVRLNAQLRLLNELPPGEREPADDLLPWSAVDAIRKWKTEDQRLFRLAWVELASWERIAEELDLSSAEAARSRARALRRRAHRARASLAAEGREWAVA